MITIDRDAATKQVLKEISETFGCTQDTIKQAWEYTLFTLLLSVAEKPDGFERLPIPHIGNLILKNNGYKTNDEGKLEPDIEAYMSLSDSFKQLYEDVSKRQYGALSEYLEHNYIEKVADNII